MDRIFLELCNRNIQIVITVGVVLLVRLCFYLLKVPKKYSYVLWGIVFLRMLLPWQIESPWSLFPAQITDLSERYSEWIWSEDVEKDTVNGNILDILPDAFTDTVLPTVAGNTVVPSVSGQTDQKKPLGQENHLIQSEGLEGSEHSGQAEQIPQALLIRMGVILWLAGILVLLAVNTVSCCKLKKRLNCRMRQGEAVYLVDEIDIPFVFGIYRPQIYLPSNISNSDIPYVLAHERVHIQRKDFLIKLICYGATCLYWYNPLAWAAFYFLEQDMELSCDEAVMNSMSEQDRKKYAQTLLKLAVQKKVKPNLLLAFGAANVKLRIKGVIGYRKPRRTVLLVARVLSVILTVGLLTSPVSAAAELPQQEAQDEKQPFETQGYGDEDLLQKKEKVQYFGQNIFTDYIGTLYQGSKVVSGWNVLDLADEVRTEKNIASGSNPLIDNGNVVAIDQDKMLFVAHPLYSQTAVLGMMDMGGGNLRILKRWEGVELSSEGGFVLVDHKCYGFLSLREVYTEDDGWVNTTSAKGELYEIDMQTGEFRLLYEIGPYCNISLGNIRYSDGKLFVNASVQKKSFLEAGITAKEFYENYDSYYEVRHELLGIEEQTFLLDLASGQTMETEFLGVSATFWANRLLTATGKNLRSYDLATGETSDLLPDTPNGYMLYPWGDFLLIENMMQGDQNIYYICRRGELTPRRLELPYKADLILCDESDTMLYLLWVEDNGRWHHQLIDKETFFSWAE